MVDWSMLQGVLPDNITQLAISYFYFNVERLQPIDLL